MQSDNKIMKKKLGSIEMLHVNLLHTVLIVVNCINNACIKRPKWTELNWNLSLLQLRCREWIGPAVQVIPFRFNLQSVLGLGSVIPRSHDEANMKQLEHTSCTCIL